MARYNNGLIYTNTNCIACNRCIAQCSVIGANVATEQNGKSIISVNESKCNHCGKCVNVCIHDAREFKDDTEVFFNNLKSGEKISLIVDQSFYVLYDDKAPSVLAWLKKQGVDKIYDVAYGAEISLWAHVKYLLDNYDVPSANKAFIANTCSSFINEVELYNPSLRTKLIPVQSPVSCTAIYARKYLNDNNKLAYLSSCISMKDEFNHPVNKIDVAYNLTYEHISKYFETDKLPDDAAAADLTTDNLGKVLCGEGAFKDSVAVFFPSSERIVVMNDSSEKIFNEVNFFMGAQYAEYQPFLAEVYTCKHGCQMGPAVGKENRNYPVIYSRFEEIYQQCIKKFDVTVKDYKSLREEFFKHFEALNYDDFTREYVNRYHQPYRIPDEVYEEIYSVLLKDTPEKRHINCGSCGYSTCHEMASALAYGYNKKENCLHYMNDIMEKNYYTDALTGLDNQNSFIRKVNAVLSSNVDKKYAVYAGDINRLKVINDIFGFETGNEVLKFIGKSLCEVFGDKAIVARIGGGFFALFLEYNLETVETIRNIKYFDCRHLGIEMPVTMRFGAYVAESFDENVTDMLNYSTLCMDRTISSVTNTFSFFTQEYREKMMTEVNVTSQMPSALANNEFVLWFQPQYKTATNELSGAEVLCRWVKPDGTIFPPTLFIPIAEKNGFIVTLDKLIWRQAFEKMHKWLDEGLNPAPISVNISRVSLESDSMVYAIKRLDEEFKIPHHLIHFEITESAYMHDVDALISRINAIREMGYSIAMDDFGSGYSSLNSLKDIPLDMIKLDMGFFNSGSNMDKGGSVISSVIHMAQALELITIAEGVETETQANFLTSIGCDIIQGFLYSKPLCCEDYEKLLKGTDKRIIVQKPHIFGSLNINNFYNPDSCENIMFEQFSGPAAIFEFNNLEYRAKLIRINKKTLTLFGAENVPVSEISVNIRNYFSPETRKVILNTMQEIIETGSEKSCVAECRTVNKQEMVWVKFHFWLLSSIGNRHTIYCLMEDITEEKISENTLLATNSQMSMLMDNTTVGLLLMHLQVDWRRPFETIKLRVLKYNKQFIENSGYPEEEVANWTEVESFGVVHPLDKPKFMAKLFVAYTNHFEKPVSIYYRARHKNGSYVKCRMIITGIKQDKGSYFLATSYVNFGNADKELAALEDSDFNDV